MPIYRIGNENLKEPKEFSFIIIIPRNSLQELYVNLKLFLKLNFVSFYFKIKIYMYLPIHFLSANIYH